MTVSTQSFTTIVGNMVAAIQGAATSLIDFTTGSVLRAFTEAVAAVALWLQGLALQVAALTRFATSTGSDADSWGADFGFVRLVAQQASGSVTFSRYTSTFQAVIPVGAVVQTADATQQFTVIADTTQTAYNSTLNAYVIAAGISSCTATVQSVNYGTQANVAAGIISVIANAIANVSTVTNASAFTNGSNAESDAAFKARFVTYIASLSQATPVAVQNAVIALQQDVSCQITENYNYAGTYTPGNFYVVVDDGSGAPPSSFLTAVTNAVNAVRPACSTFQVYGPSVVSANIAMNLTTSSGYVHATVVSAVTAAITTYVNTLPVGTSLHYTQLAALAYSTSAGITNVSGLTLNGGTVDLSASGKQVIKIGSLSVS